MDRRSAIDRRNRRHAYLRERRRIRTVSLSETRALFDDKRRSFPPPSCRENCAINYAAPWTHDFRDCMLSNGASNHPDIVQPVLPPNTPPSQPWNAAVPWERRTPNPHHRSDAAGNRPRAGSGRTAPLRNQQSLAGAALVVGRREIAAPFVQTRRFRCSAPPIAAPNSMANLELCGWRESWRWRRNIYGGVFVEA